MEYAYDAAGRLVKEGDKVYSYIGLDKIESVTMARGLICTAADSPLAFVTGMVDWFIRKALVFRCSVMGTSAIPAESSGPAIPKTGRSLFRHLQSANCGI